MFRIGEFSQLVKVTPRMLRYYEKNGLIKPKKIDPDTGYRFYSASQINLVNKIVKYRDMGFLVEQIEMMIEYRTDEHIIQEMIATQQALVEQTIDSENAKLHRLKKYRKTMTEEKSMIEEAVLKSLPAVNVLSLRDHIASYDQEFDLWFRMKDFIEKEAVECLVGGYSIYHDPDYKENDVDVEIAVPVDVMKEDKDGFVYKTYDAIPLAATIRFTGSYELTSQAIEKLAAWMEFNGYVFDGLMRGCAINDPCAPYNPEITTTEIQIPVKKV